MFFRIHAEAEIAALARARDAVSEVAEYSAHAAANRAAQSARDTALYKDRTGKLRGKIQVGGSRFNQTVTANTKYASFVESGTKAHVIEGRNGGSLHFKIAGHWVTAKRVNHPGTKPRPFMALASLAGAEVMERSLQRGVEQLAGKHNK